MNQEQVDRLSDKLLGFDPLRVEFHELFGWKAVKVYRDEVEVGVFIGKDSINKFYFTEKFTDMIMVMEYLKDEDRRAVLKGLLRKMLSLIDIKFPRGWHPQDLVYYHPTTDGYLFM